MVLSKIKIKNPTIAHNWPLNGSTFPSFIDTSFETFPKP